MWSKAKHKPDLQRFSGKTSLIAVGAHWRGELRFDGAVQIDGKIDGDVLTEDGLVRISEVGRVEGRVRAPHVVIEGEVVGDVFAGQSLELGAKARVRGTLHYAVMEMAAGAQIDGHLCRLSESVDRPLELPDLQQVEQ